MLSKILIANRGEIAVRIIRACKEMGVETVALYSEADRDSLHVSLADESYCVGPALPKDSYLNMAAILSLAISSGAKAIHPGYGFLAENAKFASLCQKCNLVFIGPNPEVISSMGDKNMARKTMIEAGVLVIPGSEILKSIEDAIEEGKKIGYPLLIKAKAGGGGKGIRRVDREEDLSSTYFQAIAEAKLAFGDGDVYMEKFLSPVKHIEVQILADNYGNIVSLGERDCSIQRRNQKLIEESPSPLVGSKLRKLLEETSIKAAKAAYYTGLGTIEYLLDKDNNYYFMEMNTRLQVEHPVTEFVTGIDLVKWQIRIASGAALEFDKEETKIKGHAIECRINAENDKGWSNGPNKVSVLHIPGGAWVRFDTAIYQDYEIPIFYDSMIGKLIVHAKTREEAIRKMQTALSEIVIGGVETNIDKQIENLSDSRFISGEYSTSFIRI